MNNMKYITKLNDVKLKDSYIIIMDEESLLYLINKICNRFDIHDIDIFTSHIKEYDCVVVQIKKWEIWNINAHDLKFCDIIKDKITHFLIKA